MTRMSPTRRSVLAVASALPLAAPAAMAQGRVDAGLPTSAQLQTDLARYDALGDKAAGGEGDAAVGAWLEGELRRLGFSTSRQMFRTPFFTAERAELTAGGARATVLPQGIVIPTPPQGVEGRLTVSGEREVARGDIALIVLPYARWSAARNAAVRVPVTEALAAGAQAAVVVTTGPTGEAIALNAPYERPLFDKPVAVLAPSEAAPFLAAARAGGRARLVLSGTSGLRPAYNLIGEKRGGSRDGLVVSTPRSGWFKCTGERGPGIAAWLSLARWLGAGRPARDLTFLATSGHEYDNQGGVLYLAERAPKPEATRLWAHLGANVATRDWHETAAGLLPLPSADPQRFLVGTANTLPVLERTFAGLPGLARPYPSEGGAEGELKHVLESGYRRAFGVFGGHRRHHARTDDLRSTSGELVLPAALAFRSAIAQLVRP